MNFSISEIPFTIYCDFETIVERQSIDITEKTHIYQKHTPCGFSIVLIDLNYNVLFTKFYNGKNCVKIFLKYMFEISKNLKLTLNKIAPMKDLNKSEERMFQESRICHICEKEITKFDIKVRDHCHLFSHYRGASHLICNLNYQITKKIPVIMHNLKNFDSNIILRVLDRKYFKKVYVLPKSTEKYLSFTLDNLKFIDSYQFLPTSLSNLVENLKTSGSNMFKITRKVFENVYGAIDNNDFNKVLQKSAYPYEYMDNFDKFNDEYLPGIDKFESSLNFSKISEDKYKNAIEIWNLFEFKNMRDFHNFYVLLDSCLLCDVFTVFRKKIMNFYGLDPLHYYSIPSLSWDCMLKFTKIKIELLRDIDQYLYIENNLRGGISQVSKRFSSANNVKMFEDFKPEDDTKFISYLDGIYFQYFKKIIQLFSNSFFLNSQ